MMTISEFWNSHLLSTRHAHICAQPRSHSQQAHRHSPPHCLCTTLSISSISIKRLWAKLPPALIARAVMGTKLCCGCGADERSLVAYFHSLISQRVFANASGAHSLRASAHSLHEKMQVCAYRLPLSQTLDRGRYNIINRCYNF